MSIVENEGQPLQNRAYRQHLDKNWNAINQYEKNVNAQIKQVLSNPPASSADEVTQLRIDTNGNEYPLAKPRIDSIERDASYAASEVVKKADKNYINDYLSQVNYSPEAVASFSDLTTKYPNGKPGLFVAADNGHKYIWVNGTWKDSGIYQSQGIVDGSIAPGKLAANAQKAILFANSIVYDFSTRKLTIGGQPARIYWSDQSDASDKTYYDLPTNGATVNKSIPGNAWKLTFDITDKQFKIQSWGHALGLTELYVFGVVETKATYPQELTVIGDNKVLIKSSNKITYSSDYTDLKLPIAKVVGTTAAKPTVNSSEGVLHFPAGHPYDVLVGNTVYNGAIPDTGLDVDLKTIDASTVKWLLLFDVSNKSIKIDKSDNANHYNNEAALLATIRYDPTSGTHKYWFNAYFPIVEDDRINGTVPYVTEHMPKAQILSSFQYPNINTKTKMLEFKNGSDRVISGTDFIVDGKAYSGVIPREGKTFDLSQLTASTAYYLFLDMQKNELVFDSFYHLTDYTYGLRYALVATIRKNNEATRFIMNLDVPYTIDGVLYGIKNVARKSFVKSIAHRGYQPSNPENSLVAYEAAFNNGYDYVETDVQWTRDDVPVLLHDETINRTARNSDGSVITDPIKVSDLTLEQLRAYDFGIAVAPDFKGMKITTFDEFLNLCKRKGLNAYIDKNQTDEHAAKIVELVKWHNMQNHVSFVAPEIETLKLYRKYDSNCRIGINAAMISDEGINALKSLGGNVFVSLQQERLLDTPNQSQQAKDAGVELETWTIYDTSKIDELIDLGVIGITSNSVDVNGYLIS